MATNEDTDDSEKSWVLELEPIIDENDQKRWLSNNSGAPGSRKGNRYESQPNPHAFIPDAESFSTSSEEPANKKPKPNEALDDKNHPGSFLATAPPADAPAVHQQPSASPLQQSADNDPRNQDSPLAASAPLSSSLAGHHQADHYVVVGSKNGKKSQQRAKASLTRRFWDRIVKRRQESTKKKTKPNEEELKKLISMLHGELVRYYKKYVPMPVFVQEIKRGMLCSGKDDEAMHSNSHCYRLLSKKDGTLTPEGKEFLVNFVSENHNFKTFVGPLDDSFVEEANTKADSLSKTNPRIKQLVKDFKGMVDGFRERLSHDYDSDLERMFIQTVNKVWENLVNKQPLDEVPGLPPGPGSPPGGLPPGSEGSPPGPGGGSGSNPQDKSSDGEEQTTASGPVSDEGALAVNGFVDHDMSSLSSVDDFSGSSKSGSDETYSEEELDEIEVKGNLIISRILDNKMANIDSKDENGWTALHHVSFLGHLYYVGYLLHQGADVRAKTNQGETPLDLARAGREIRVVELLLRAGESYLLQSSRASTEEAFDHSTSMPSSMATPTVDQKVTFVSQDSSRERVEVEDGPFSELPSQPMLGSKLDLGVAPIAGHSFREQLDEECDIPRNRSPFQPSPGAWLTFQEMMNNSPPVDVPQEDFMPEIHPALVNPLNVQVLPPSGHSRFEVPPIYLLRQDGAERAYALMPHKRSIQFKHHPWVEIFSGIVYKHSSEYTGSSNVYQAPSVGVVEYVAIKRFNRRAVDKYLKMGGRENPYKDVHRMQELGDNKHVLMCLDALEDDEYLYIVTPMGTRRTLADAIQWNTNDMMEPTRVRLIFRKILQILAYLERHGICHRDISPDNFLFLTEDNLVVFDLALSHRLPTDEQGRRCLITPQGDFGTRTYMAPEIFLNRIFCGVYSDLWSAGTILYNLLTNRALYHIPDPIDSLFRYILLARGLSSNACNDLTNEVLQEANREEHFNLFERANLHTTLSPEAIELLENLLAVSISDRWTLGQAMESAFVQGDD